MAVSTSRAVASQLAAARNVLPPGVTALSTLDDDKKVKFCFHFHRSDRKLSNQTTGVLRFSFVTAQQFHSAGCQRRAIFPNMAKSTWSRVLHRATRRKLFSPKRQAEKESDTNTHTEWLGLSKNKVTQKTAWFSITPPKRAKKKRKMSLEWQRTSGEDQSIHSWIIRLHR